MATGRSTQLARQIGEHLVAAELGRLGLIATPFAGNVPLFDLLVADEAGHTIPVQVKAIRGPSWQFNARDFLEIEIIDEFQHVRGKKELANPALVCVYVLLGERLGEDTFFIFPLEELQEFTFGKYKSRRRPKNPNSTHCAVWPQHLERFKDNWQLVFDSVHRTGGEQSGRA